MACTRRLLDGRPELALELAARLGVVAQDMHAFGLVAEPAAPLGLAEAEEELAGADALRGHVNRGAGATDRERSYSIDRVC